MLKNKNITIVKAFSHILKSLCDKRFREIEKEEEIELNNSNKSQEEKEGLECFYEGKLNAYVEMEHFIDKELEKFIKG